MEPAKGILILYHSGAGSTKTLGEIYHKLLAVHCSVDIEPISLEYDYTRLSQYDFFVFAFPTYHCDPSASMLAFIEKMPPFTKKTRGFAFTTCGLYSGNTLRTFIKACSTKNIGICGYATYRAPATDGALLLPSIPMIFTYEKNIAIRIKHDIERIRNWIDTGTGKRELPPFKLSAILNYPNKVLGKAYPHRIRVSEEDCIGCKTCIRNCIRHCWKEGQGHPMHQKENCELCYRCVHHCPKEAIVLSDKTKRKPKLNEKFYRKLKEEILDKERNRVDLD